MACPHCKVAVPPTLLDEQRYYVPHSKNEEIIIRKYQCRLCSHTWCTETYVPIFKVPQENKAHE